MKKATRIILGLTGVSGAGVAGIVAYNRYLQRARNQNPIMEDQFDEDSYDGDFMDHLVEPHDISDGDLCPDDTDMKAECPIFGEEKRLLPGEKKFLDEFLDGVQAITTIMSEELCSVDLLARTSNMPCKLKCDRIRGLCKELQNNCRLIAGISDDVLRVLRKQHCDEYLDFLNNGIARMEKEGNIDGQ